MSTVKANVLLLVAAVLWGVGYVPQKMVLSHIDPFSAVGLRCLIGGLLLLPLVRRRADEVRPAGERISLIRVALPFTIGLTLQQAAFLGESVTNAGFLINTAAVICPVAAYLMLGEKPRRQTALAAGFCLAGAVLLAGGIDRISATDLVALGSAVAYAVWTVELGRHARAHGRPLATAAAQFLAAAAITLPIGWAQGGLTLDRITLATPNLLLLALFPTALAFGLQTMAMRVARPVEAAIIVSAESLIGALSAAAVLGERMSATAGPGGLLILVAILLSSLPSGPGLGGTQRLPWPRSSVGWHRLRGTAGRAG